MAARTKPLLLGLAVLLLAACASGGGGAPRPSGDPRAAAAYSDVIDSAIEVRVSEIHPRAVVRDVRLEGPDDSRVSGALMAQIVNEADAEETGGPVVDLGVKGGSSGKIIPGVGLSWSPGSAARRDEIWLIPLPGSLPRPIDPEQWRIRVDYLDFEGLRRYIKLGLPEPPA